MIRLIIGILLIVHFSVSVVGQNNYPKIFFEVGYSHQQTKMENFNNHLDLIENDVFKLNDYLESVNNVQIVLRYKPKPIFDFGIYGGRQAVLLESFPLQKKLNPDLTVTNVEGYHKNQIESWSLGLVATVYFDQFLRSHDKLFERVNLGMELLGGIGFSSYFLETHFVTFSPIGISSATRKSQGFQGQLGFIVEYDFVRNPLIGIIGLRVGYQFYATSTLENRLGYKWGDQNYDWTSADSEVNLDFSGIYYGVYLKFGK